MKKIITISLLTVALFNIANANDKFADLSADYLNTKASLNVRTTIAKDPQTAVSVLKILAQDSNDEVREYADRDSIFLTNKLTVSVFFLGANSAYKSIVVIIDLCPKRTCSSFQFAPAFNSNDA